VEGKKRVEREKNILTLQPLNPSTPQPFKTLPFEILPKKS
jgi:SOS-response transcriptional repressor LexA